MKQKNWLTLDDEFIQYCKINNIEDVGQFAKDVFNKGFTIIKYGSKPNITNNPIITPTNTPTPTNMPEPSIDDVVITPEPIVELTPQVTKIRDLYDE